MRRDAMQELYDWKEKSTRKPFDYSRSPSGRKDMAHERVCGYCLQTVCLHQLRRTMKCEGRFSKKILISNVF